VTRLLAPIALLLFLAALAVGVVNSLHFLRVAFPEIHFPIAEFDANVEVPVRIDQPQYRCVVYVLVPAPDSKRPDTAVSITDADGNPLEFTETPSGYAHLVGRYYKRLGRFSVDTPQTVTASVESGPLEDFAILRDIGDVVDRRTGDYLPGWLAAGVLLILSLASLMGFVLTSEKRMERRLSDANA